MRNEAVRELIDRVRKRWRAQRLFEATVRGALAASAAVGVALVAARWSTGAPGLLAFVVAVALLLAAAALGRAFWPLRRSPGDIQVARFIEERAPALEDRLVSAVDVANPTHATPLFADLMLADAGRRAQDVDVDAVLPAIALRRAGFQAAASVLVLVAVLWAARGPTRQAVDSASLSLFPDRVALEVTPGNARIKAGSALAIAARLVGNRAPIVAQLQIADGDRWRASEMSTDAPGSFRFGVDAVTAPFKYRVAAGPLTSPVYEVAVAYAPRVKRIDVEYTYPAGLRLPSRTESDGGDIYAPPGTDVRVRVFTDRPAATGEMTLGDGKRLALTSEAPTELSTSLKVVDDNSYRVALVDREGMGTSGETEYFIRTLDDRPPDVRILKPASDRSVTRLEEVDVEVQAEDDYGVERLDLVYSVHGTEKVVPLPIPRRSALVSGRHTLYLEDLDVQPGDVVSYYVRARDLTRGTRPNEARSDMFFLEVKPYEQEFVLARSQGAMAGAGANGLDDLVVAQKEVVAATWKLDRRAQAAKGAKSEQDIRSVSRAEADLKTRAEQTSSTFRESTMRDPRRRQPQRGRGGPEPLKAGETLPEEDEMAAAAAAMGKAVGSLDGLKTAEALPHELEALNRLLKAQSAVKRREVSRQQAGNGDGNTNRNFDLSAMFDKELQKAQQTNYETKSSAESKSDPNQSALDKIKDLAQRQDELLKRQQELAKNRDAMQEEELKRELEKLSRDQAELRQRAEELARQMNAQQGQSADSKRQEKDTPGQGQSGQQGKSGQGGGGDASQQMRDAAEEMRNATSELRRQDPKQASARGSRALDKLRETARQLEGARPDDRRRALGETQLEARQMADAERQIASELGKAGPGDAGKDAVRRLAGEQERLAERARKLQETLKRQGSEGSKGSKGSEGSEGSKSSEGSKGSRGSSPVQTSQAAGDAARELEAQRIAERMQQTAEAMRAATADARGLRGSTAQPDTTQQARGQVGAQQDLARALDKVADKLASANGASDSESQKLSEQLARAQELREGLQRLGQTGQNGRGGQGGAEGPSARKSPGESGEPGQGQQGGGGGTGTDLGKLREEYQRRLQETKELVDQLRRDDPNFARGGGGSTLEGAGGVFASPGTEAFKQDFAKWEDLRRQATQALEQAEASLSKKLQAKQAKDRLAAGADDNPPPEYKKQVDSYFKAIAGKKKP
ncbi:MAG TPA: DUF4175 family protein [Vicinamibacterales bacterium]|jgi:Domain of unknown function (DUF4175)|nr:DUF4175 family protein [Vicinamibacterales bacterium]